MRGEKAVESQQLTNKECAAEVQLLVEAQSTPIERLNKRIQETEDPDELENLLI